MTNDSSGSPQAMSSATGSDDYWDTELMPGEEPVVTGTLFLVVIILMLIAAIWVIMYFSLLER